MKKLLLITLIAFVTTSDLRAQTEKGNVMVGGEVLLLAQSGNTTFSASPNIGYFFLNDFAGGAELNLITGGGYTNWGIGPYLRGYFAGNPTGKLFAQLGLALTGSSYGSGTSQSSAGLSGRLGYAAFLNKHVALEFAGRILTGGKNVKAIYGLGAGFQIHLGK
jgi:hypothetical protein